MKVECKQMHEANGHKFRMCFFKESFNWSNHRIIWLGNNSPKTLTNLWFLIRNFESNQHFVLIVPILFGELGSKDFNVIIVNSLFIRKVFKLTNSQSQSRNLNLKTNFSDVKNLSLSDAQKCYQQRYQIMNPSRHIRSKEIIRI